MRILYFDCFSGISGNMILGAFLDAGMPLGYLQGELSKLKLEESYRLVCEKVKKNGLSATYFNVDCASHHQHQGTAQPHKRNLRCILEIIEESSLAPEVKKTAARVFRRLGEAEAAVHDCDLQDIHFHEVGAVDAIIDIVGAALGLAYFEAEKIYVSPLHVGSGLVKCAHGLFPIPAPATAWLLTGMPIYSSGVEGELVTPTGAAVISALAEGFGPLPAFVSEKVSYGAGSWDLPLPNVVRLYMGKTVQGKALYAPYLNAPYEEAVMIEATIDDLNPELYSYLLEKLLAAGAADVYYTPVYMKKNRPGVQISVTCDLPDQRPLLEIIFAETTTLGVRFYPVRRHKLAKSFREVETPWGVVRVKLGSEGGEIRNMAPEYEDCRAVAKRTGLPLKRIYQEVLARANEFWRENDHF